MSGTEFDVAAVDAVLAELVDTDGALPTPLLGRALRRLRLAPSLGQLQQWADEYATPPSTHDHSKTHISRAAFHSIAHESYVSPTDQREDFIACMRMFDRYGDGRVRVAELRAALQHDGEPMPEAEIDAAMALLAPAVVMEEGEACIRPDKAAALLFPQLGTTPAVSVAGVGGGDSWEGLGYAQHSGNTWEHELATVVRERDDVGVRAYLDHLSDAELHDVLVWVALHAGDPRLPDIRRYSRVINEMLRGQVGTGADSMGTLPFAKNHHAPAPFAEDPAGLAMLPRPPLPPPDGGGSSSKFEDAGAEARGDAARGADRAAAQLAARGGVAEEMHVSALRVLQKAIIRRYGFRNGGYAGSPADFCSAVTIMSEQLQRFAFLLRNGLEVVKFPRQGKPRVRVMWLHGDGSLRLGQMQQMAASRATAAAAASPEGHGERILPLQDLTRVLDGAVTAAFNGSPAYKTDVEGQEECCLTILGKPAQPQFNIKLPTKKGTQLFSAKFNAMITMLRGPKGKPWGPNARQVSVRYFATHGHAPSDKLLLAVREEEQLSEAELAALSPNERDLHEAMQVNNAIGRVHG